MSRKLFNSIPAIRPKRTVFDLSYSNKLSLGFGELCPMLLEKTVPTDKFIMNDEFMCRFAPFYGQVFQAFKLRTEYFHVPSRILWKNFELFKSDGFDGSTQYVHPYLDMSVIWAKLQLDSSSSLINTIFDYFNLPTDAIDPTGIGTKNFKIDALPFYAYAKAFMDYYADENLEYMGLLSIFSSGADFAIDGDNTWRLIWLFYAIQGYVNDINGVMDWATWYNHYDQGTSTWPVDSNGQPITVVNCFKPFRRSYPKDYFTSALPFAQRGPIVQIPLNGSGDVRIMGIGQSPSGGTATWYQGVGVAVPPATYGSDIEVSLYQYGLNLGSPNNSTYVDSDGGTHSGYKSFMAGSSTDSAQDAANEIGQNSANAYPLTFKAVNVNGTATITDLRTAAVVQSWLEKRARTGVRAGETDFASFGVRTKDYRLDRTEFISGFRSTVKIGEVFTTNYNDDGTDVPGLGVSVGQLADGSPKWKYKHDERGYTFGIISLYPEAAYFQGVPRQFLELDSMDYYWPEFQHIGEQQIYNCELMVDDNNNNNNMDAFGYAPRGAHYKSRTDQIHGDFRQSLKTMTAAREFSTNPTLSNSFVQVQPALNNLYRVFNAVGDWTYAKPCTVDIFHHFKAIRPMSYYGNPRLI